MSDLQSRPKNSSRMDINLNPQTKPVKCIIGALKTMMVYFINKDQRLWGRHLPKLRFAYNTACHSTLKGTTAFLNLWREPKPINSLRRREEGEPQLDPQATGF